MTQPRSSGPVMSGIPSSGSSVTDGAHGRAIPVVPCAHASTGCGPGAGSVGAITRPLTATGWSRSSVDTYSTFQPRAPSGRPSSNGSDRRIVPGAPLSSSGGS